MDSGPYAEKLGVRTFSARTRRAVLSEHGFTLIELLVTMALLLTVMTALTASFASGTKSEAAVSKRQQAQSDARRALTRMRDDLHCAYQVQAVGPRDATSDSGFYLYLSEQYNTCKAVDSSSSGNSKVFLAWCTVPVAGSPGVYALYRTNLLGSSSPLSTCDSSGTLEVTGIVAPQGGWPSNSASGSPSTWNGNIWSDSLITCTQAQTGYLPTVAVDMGINPDLTGAPNETYELKDQIALRNGTRCNTSGGGGLKASPTLSVSAPAYALTGTNVPAASISATLAGSSSPAAQITFFVKSTSTSTAPTTCSGSGWSTVGSATPMADGTYNPSAALSSVSTGYYWWYASFAGDTRNNSASTTCGTGMTQTRVVASKVTPTITLSAPATATTGTNISSLGVTVSGSQGATGTLTLYVYQGASNPGTCPGGAGWTTVGTLTPNGDGTYGPPAGFTPSSATTYWWYASFAGDGTDNASASACSSSMARTVVTNPPDTFAFSSISTQAAGASFTATITANQYGGLTDTAYSGTKTLTFTGPADSPGGTAPTYPATVTFASGVATGVSFTLYNAAPTTLTASQGAITGSSNSFTVGTGATSKLSVSTPSTPTAGASFGVQLTATDTWGNTTGSFTGTKAITWTNPVNSPNGTAPSYSVAATSVTFTSGVGSAAGITLYNAASTTLKATATVGGYNGTSGSFTVGPAAASAFSFAAVGNQAAGTAFNASLTAKDPYGNVDTNYAGAKTITWSGASNSPNGTAPQYPSSVTFAAGAGTASGIKAFKAGSTTLTATQGSASGTSAAFTVSSAPVTLALSACATNKVNSGTWTFTVSRSGTDAYGNSDSNLGTGITVSISYSDTATGSHKGSVSPTSRAVAGGATTSASFTVTNPNQSGKTVTITASAAGYGTSASCSYTTT